MTFPTPSLDAEALAEHIKNVSPGELARLASTALDLLTLAFEDSWRDPSTEIADDCLIRVVQALRDGKRTTNAGKQLATVEGGAGARPALDPLDSVRPILARFVVAL